MVSQYKIEDDCGDQRKEPAAALEWSITNVGGAAVEVEVLDAYTGNADTRLLDPNQTFTDEVPLADFHN